jgi:hypothetical protein
MIGCPTIAHLAMGGITKNSMGHDVFAFLVVVLGEDLLLFVAFAFIFCIFCPKNACQVPKSPNHIQINNIRVAF